MQNSSSTIASLLAGFCFAQLLLLAPSSAAENPNILFIYTDDQAPWAIGASGNPDAITPNMDRLAQEGAYLPNRLLKNPAI
jgi:uncharacterized sulfatase